MSSWVGAIDRIMLAVEVRLLVKIGVASDEPPHLRVIVTRSHLLQPRVPVRTIAACRPVTERTARAARAAHEVAERIAVLRSRHALTAACHRPLIALPVVKRFD